MDEDKIQKLIETKSWMIRPCELYLEEYNDCTSIRSRFHQKFVGGVMVDCSQWKRDYNNCVQWTEEENKRAFKELIDSEEARKKERMDAYYGNDIWEKRKEPPPGWDDPLPAWIEDKFKNSYLRMKTEELKEKESGVEKERTLCVVS